MLFVPYLFARPFKIKSPTISVSVSDLPADHVSVKLRVTEKLYLIDMSNFQIFTYIYKCGGRVYLGIKCLMLW